jgi:hypothetical protein
MIEWQYDSMVVLQYGCMAAWQHGSMVVWQHGSMAAWQHGSMAAWQHGSMAAWQHGSEAAQRAEALRRKFATTAALIAQLDSRTISIGSTVKSGSLDKTLFHRHHWPHRQHSRADILILPQWQLQLSNC